MVKRQTALRMSKILCCRLSNILYQRISNIFDITAGLPYAFSHATTEGTRHGRAPAQTGYGTQPAATGRSRRALASHRQRARKGKAERPELQQDRAARKRAGLRCGTRRNAAPKGQERA